MTERFWITACLLATLIGFIVGWNVRTGTADHRYIRALAARHEAVANYYLQQSDLMIQTNKDAVRERKLQK